MKVRDVIKEIEPDRWRMVSQEERHRQFKYATKKGRVMVSGHWGGDMPIGTLKNIYKQAQMEKK
jgi:predicted RNA binding protein YcfA (HicA-like mRNA interferase family)